MPVATFCDRLGVDWLGFNFVPQSRRAISYDLAASLRSEIKQSQVVGVFQNQPLLQVNNTAQALGLDYIQLSGDETVAFVKQCQKPVIKTIKICAQADIQRGLPFLPYVAYMLLDSPHPGSGTCITVNLKAVPYPFLLAGGLSPTNLKTRMPDITPIGIDIASGIETRGSIDMTKILAVWEQLKHWGRADLKSN